MTPPPKCLYETLGVKTTATDAEIKKAYRALALERHPDKNPDDRDAAEEAFKELQHAYDVLSNPHERSWYDGHRDEILRGDDGGTGGGSGGSKKGHAGRATDINLASYLSSSVFKGFNSDAGGFYAVYADMFDRLAREEDDFRATNESDDDEANMNGGGGRLPSFSGVNADWTSVRDFYRAWDSFSSHRSFVFADKWNLADTPRLFRREMERENRRLRTSARKEFNALVREVVAHAKKRDPRVARRKIQEEQARKEQERLKEERKREQERQRQETMKEVRAAREQALEEDGEALDTILASIALDERIERRQRREKRRRARAKSDGRDDDDGGGDENAVVDEDNDGEDVQQQGQCNGAVEVDGGDDDDEVVVDDGAIESNGAQQTNGEMEGQDDIDSGSSEDMDDDDGVLAEELYCAACRKLLRTAGQMADHIRSKKHKLAEARLRRRLVKEEAQFEASQKQTDGTPEADNEDTRDADNEDSIVITDDVEVRAVESMGSLSNKSKKKKKKKRGKQQLVVSGSLGEDSDDKGVCDVDDKPQAQEDNDDDDRAGGKGLSKREKRKLREKRKREDEAAGGGGGGGGGGNRGGDKAAGHACNKCGATFDSRTKLMRHVRDAGHALHVGR